MFTFSIPEDVQQQLENLVFNQVKRAFAEIYPIKPEPVKDELLTIAKAAELLSVSVPTVYGYVHQKQIPYMKRRGRLYFSKIELLTWVQSGRRATTDEIKRDAINSLSR